MTYRFSLPVEQEENQESDPLIRQIGKKLRAHGGFIVEALVESVPQSILQMVFIVLTGTCELRFFPTRHVA